MAASVEYRVLTEKDHDQVWDIIMTVYRTGDPAMAISEFSDEDMECFEDYVKERLIRGVSLGAFDKKTNKLAGLSLSVLGKHGTDEGDKEEKEAMERLPLKMKQQVAIVEYMTGENTAATFGTRDYMNYAILCCRPEYGGRGIGTELFRRSEEIARREECNIILITASSAFTQKIAKKLGFITKKSVNFCDYVDPYTGKKIFESIQEPHKIMTLEVKEL